MIVSRRRYHPARQPKFVHVKGVIVKTTKRSYHFRCEVDGRIVVLPRAMVVWSDGHQAMAVPRSIAQEKDMTYYE
jgi:hypothetical protein